MPHLISLQFQAHLGQQNTTPILIGVRQMMHAVDHLIERFPQRKGVVRRLYLRDEQFRAICEDLALALRSLRQFEQLPDSQLRPEVDDYRTVIHELEEELTRYIIATEHP